MTRLNSNTHILIPACFNSPSKATHKNSICQWSAIIPAEPRISFARDQIHVLIAHRMGQLKTSKTSQHTQSPVFGDYTARLKSTHGKPHILCFISAASNLLVATCPEHISQTDFARWADALIDATFTRLNMRIFDRDPHPDQMHSGRGRMKSVSMLSHQLNQFEISIQAHIHSTNAHTHPAYSVQWAAARGNPIPTISHHSGCSPANAIRRHPENAQIVRHALGTNTGAVQAFSVQAWQTYTVASADSTCATYIS